MSNTLPPIVSEVTSTEALRSGSPANTPKTLSAKQKSNVGAFIKAHQKPAQTTQSVEQQNLTADLQAPQVSHAEQALAVVARGLSDDKPVKEKLSPSKRAYLLLFSSDRKFLNADLEHFQQSLKSGLKSLVDLATALDPQQKALRKWLLTQVALETVGQDSAMRGLLERAAKQLEQDHGDFIRSTMAAIDAGRKLNTNAPQLREFVKAYQLMDLSLGGSSGDSSTSEVLQMFKALRSHMERPDPTPELVQVHNSVIATLQREKTQMPAKATTTRQHILLSRINQMKWLIQVVSLHQRFLKTCQKAQVHALPRLSDLVEACLQTVIASDIFSGINALVRMAGAVDSSRPGSQNLFITNYNRLILQNDLLRSVYRGNFHRKQVVDHLDKTVKSAGILAQSSKNSTAAA